MFLTHALIFLTQLSNTPQAVAKQLCMVTKMVLTGGQQRKDVALKEGKWW